MKNSAYAPYFKPGLEPWPPYVSSRVNAIDLLFAEMDAAQMVFAIAVAESRRSLTS